VRILDTLPDTPPTGEQTDTPQPNYPPDIPHTEEQPEEPPDNPPIGEQPEEPPPEDPPDNPPPDMSARSITVAMFDSGNNGWGGSGSLKITVNGTIIASNAKVSATNTNNKPVGQCGSNTYTFTATSVE